MAFTNKLQSEVYSAAYCIHAFEPNQCTGRTTAYALNAIQIALLNPEMKVDLFAAKQLDTQVSKETVKMTGGFVDYVEELIGKLGLRFMVVDKVNATLTYKLYND